MSLVFSLINIKFLKQKASVEGFLACLWFEVFVVRVTSSISIIMRAMLIQFR